MDTGSGHLFSWSKNGSDFGDDKDLNEIETDYGDDKDLNQVETDYRDDKNNIEIETNYKNNKDDVEIETDYGNDEKGIFLKAAACHNPSLSHPRPANVPDPNDKIASIAKFNMMQSSLLADSMAVGPNLLTSVANWKCGSTRDIYTRMLKGSRICQAIYTQFGLIARPW